ncbi:head-tail adaptor protein [Cognatishimia activa]|uniref:Bacteriophage head-tail adaptor n=1 Tax=Cognatishimia activa TaxID=1715691 RepID=A0A0P1IYS6_9RHOB|nr:head-tail adaptor protein [Cognatishimia activa]CUJ38544.1 Bacteriophage head-tail adaptor [Cognatishimia activa]CUK26929.1 Bacteriophage head-tail adaptor [Cognatishimia activa]
MRQPMLNRLMVLEAVTRNSDGAGGFVESWDALGQLWAEVRPRSGGERDREDVGVSRLDVKVTVRGAPVGSMKRPVAGQRFREGARVFRIMAVTEPDVAGRYLTCLAREEVAA